MPDTEGRKDVHLSLKSSWTWVQVISQPQTLQLLVNAGKAQQ